MSHMLLCHGGVMKSQALTKWQQMATYFSALVHDYEHGGLNNDFLVHCLTSAHTLQIDDHPCCTCVGIHIQVQVITHKDINIYMDVLLYMHVPFSCHFGSEQQNITFVCTIR